MRRLVIVLGALLVLLATGSLSASAQSASDWTSFMYDNTHSGYNSAETSITPATVPNLTNLWTDSTSGAVSSQPVVADGVLYYGSWDGYIHAVNATTGAPIWSTFVGTNTSTNCDPPSAGPAGTPTVANGVVYVPGGDSNFYALDATNGNVVWKTSLGTPPASFLWGSPTVANGHIYMGLASFGDCPLVRGGIVEMDPTTGAIQNTLYTTTTACSGASVWSTPAVDPATGDLYFGTGNESTKTGCGPSAPGALPQSIIQTDANLNILSSWQVPLGSQIQDGDFGGSATVFTALIGKPAVQHTMVGMTNKNGVLYVFDVTANPLSAGYVWHRQIAFKGNCPDCGKSDISTMAFNGSFLYAAGGKGTVAGITCNATIREIKPATGGLVWTDCLPTGPAVSPVTITPGVVFVTAGNTVFAIAASNGATLWTYQDSTSTTNWPGAPVFFGGPAVSNGVMYAGNQDGNLYAFSVPGS